MPRHIKRLTLLLVLFVVAVFLAIRFFTVDSFYRYGHYRGNSVAEIASDKPKFKTPAYCQQCHEQEYQQWSTGVHNSASLGKVVKCEVCHGPAGGRDVKGPYDHVATGPDHPKNLKMSIPADTRKLCTLCHEKMPGRPAEQRQIVVASHAGSQQCTACHNPHSPRTFVGGAVVEGGPAGNPAAGQAKSGMCQACHGKAGVSVNLPGPSLAGQKEVYLAVALRSYVAGQRANPMMATVAKGLSDADIADLASYYTHQNCESPGDGDKKAAAAGEKITDKCSACHGSTGVSAQPSWPNLTGRSAKYLAAALRAYKNGERKNVMMGAVVKDLSESDMEALAAFYANAGCK